MKEKRWRFDTSVGSTFEVVVRGFLALDRGYITEQVMKPLYDEGELLGRAINAFRKTLGDTD